MSETLWSMTSNTYLGTRASGLLRRIWAEMRESDQNKMTHFYRARTTSYCKLRRSFLATLYSNRSYQIHQPV